MYFSKAKICPVIYLYLLKSILLQVILGKNVANITNFTT